MICPDEQAKAVGVVICDGGGSLAQGLDLEVLTGRLRELPGVVQVARCSTFGKKGDGAAVLKQVHEDAQRIVIAGSQLETFGAPLAAVVRKNKINDALVQAVNIAEQCGRVHKDGAAATDKAFELISAAVRRLAVSEPIKTVTAKLCRDVVVIGGGVAGMQTAVAVAKLGHQVTLINADNKLGGVAAKMPELYGYLADDLAGAEAIVRKLVAELIDQVNNNEQITVCSNTTAKAVKGQLGDFTVEIIASEGKKEIAAGAVVLACGTRAGQATGMGGRCVDIAGLMNIVREKAVPRRVAIIMDTVGQQGRAVCAQALSAGELLARRYGAEVKLFCDSIRVAAAGMEASYRRCRDAGVTIAKSETPPTITVGTDKASVVAFDPVAGVELVEDFDLVVMADAAGANSNGEIDGLRTGPTGESQYDDVWLLPTETNRKGIFAVGSARGNSELREAVADGLAAAEAIGQLLGSEKIKVSQDSAVVDAEKCVLCLTCLRVCPHGAISIDTKDEAARVSTIACQRCGVCAAECPVIAIQLGRYTDEQMFAEIGTEPEYVVFACENSGDQAATAAGVQRMEYDAKVRIVRVPCAGKVDPRAVLKALENGAAKVAVIGCHPGSCRYLTGSSRAEKRIERIRNRLAKVGIDESRVFFGGTTALEPQRFVEYMRAL